MCARLITRMNLSFDRLAMMKTEPEESHSVRVLLVDESSSALHALETALSKQNRIMVVGTACTEIDAQAALQTCRPHVVVLEVVIGCTSGMRLCRTIRESHPHVGVLFFTAADDAYLLRSAIDAGAQGYLLKSASMEALLKSIEAVAAGGAIVDPYLTHLVLTWIRIGMGGVLPDSSAGSSIDDLRLVSLVATGKTDGQIAQELGVDRCVIISRLYRLYNRLGITRRSEAVSRILKDESEFLPKHRVNEQFAVNPIRAREGRQRVNPIERRTGGRKARGGPVVSVP